MKVFILAGEASGDLLGAQVIKALRDKYGAALELQGLGGDAMRAAGLTPLFDMSEMAVMGLVEVLRHYRRLNRRLNDLKQAIEAFSPHVLLTIDAQGLSYRLGKHFKDAPFRKVQLVAPTVWAWKPERAAKAASYLDQMACLFPFEPKYFAAEGLPATYVGHPALNLQNPGSKWAARAQLGLAAGETWAAVLPGSRAMEVRQLCPVFGRLAHAAYAQGDLHGVLIPVAGPVRDLVQSWAKTLNLPTRILAEPQERALLPAADLALAASGTVSLELSAQGIPTLLAYRFHWLTWLYIRGKLSIDFMGLTNLLAGQEIQQEFKLNVKTEADLRSAFEGLLRSPERQAKVRAAQYEALKSLEIEDGQDFGARVAALV